MAEYNAKLHVKTSTGYDDINLQTKSEIVEFNKDGTNLSASNASDAIKEVNNKVGSLTSLLTSTKTNLVNAVNEIYNGFVKKVDIINNLVSTNTDKPLSANMGKELKTQIDSKINFSNVEILISESVTESRTYTLDKNISDYTLVEVIMQYGSTNWVTSRYFRTSLLSQYPQIFDSANTGVLSCSYNATLNEKSLVVSNITNNTRILLRGIK